MSPVGLTWFTTALLAAVVLLLLVIAAALLPRLAGLKTASFYCPWTRRNVVVRFLTREGGNPVSVVSCTAFADPRIVTCGMPCVTEAAALELASAGTAAGREARGA